MGLEEALLVVEVLLAEFWLKRERQARQDTSKKFERQERQGDR